MVTRGADQGPCWQAAVRRGVGGFAGRAEGGSKTIPQSAGSKGRGPVVVFHGSREEGVRWLR